MLKSLLPPLVLLAATSLAPAVDITRARADALIAKLSPDPWLATKDASSLAWGESYTLGGLVDLYEATGDTKYLDLLVARTRTVLSHRDDKRGFTDYSGKAHPAWSMGAKFTMAKATLKDASGRPVIELRTVPYAFNNETTIEVTAGENNSFTLRAANPHWKRTETFTNLSVDPTSPRYFEKVINHPHPVTSPPAGDVTEHSLLVRAVPIEKQQGGEPTLPAPTSFTVQPLSLAYTGYIGVIYYPILRFAALVNDTPALAEYKPAADEFVRAADESYAYAEHDWRHLPKEDEGAYLCCPRGGPFPYDNVPEPLNYLAMHGCCHLILAKLSPDPANRARYLDRATRIARLFKRRVEVRDNDALVWLYWFEPITTTGWTRENSPSDNVIEFEPAPRVEDVSHGTLDAQFLLNAAAANVVFDATDASRLRNTFMKNVLNKDGTAFNSRVDGTGPTGPLTATRVFGWLPVATIDPAVYHACRKVYEHRDEDHFPSLARLLKWERRLAASPATTPAAP